MGGVLLLGRSSHQRGAHSTAADNRFADKTSDARRRVPTLVEPLAPSAGYRFDRALARLHRQDRRVDAASAAVRDRPISRVRLPRSARSLPQSWLDAADDRNRDVGGVRRRQR